MSYADRARRGYEAAARGDFAVIAEMLAEEVKWHGGDPTAAGSCRNRTEALHFMHQARGRRGIGELVDVIDAGERVVVVMRRPSGAGESIANVTTFRDGEVTEMVHYPNVDDALAAVRR